MIGVGIGVVNNSGVSYDASAQAFFDAIVVAGGSTSHTEKAAINTYVLALKAAGIWTSPLIADYPMVGGTAASQKVNLKSPGTLDLIFVNTVAGDHTANGWLPNGTTSYARTGIIPATHLGAAAFGVEYYSRTDVVGSITFGAITVAITNVFQCQTQGLSTVSPIYSDGYNATTGRLNGGTVITSANSQFYNRQNATSHIVYINGLAHISNATGGGDAPTHEIYLGCRNNVGVANAFDAKQAAGVGFYSTGLTAPQVLAQYNARQAMNTTLGRQV